ncbi:hypothetical protein GGR58DRAFT_361265 [Xylaria digitata]|nr:hypothetical protein GGR58DRAFT_361265 [Xylaria digitata]
MEPTIGRRASSGLASRSRLSGLSRIFSGFSVTTRGGEGDADSHDRYGLTLLSDASDPIADFIFVHGLGGGSRKTWRKGQNENLFWPKEWLSRDPEFHDVRVHTFGYNADWKDRHESVLSISDFANSLLFELQNSVMIRRSKDLPMVFVCHSMGGLVVKKSFLLSQHNPVFHDIGRRYQCLFFFATPHRGASSAQLLNTLIKATAGGNAPFLGDLQQESPAIEAINDEFRHYVDQVDLFSFFETKATSILGMGEKFIVKRTSAVMGYPRERTFGLNADHRGICKFESPSESNYITVRNAMVETIDRIREIWNMNHESDIKAYRRILANFLSYNEQLNPLHVDFDEPLVDGSCEWLTNTLHFRQWRDAANTKIFWLKGTPGVGKSFLARYVIDHMSSLNRETSRYYFSASDKTRSSLAGCLLSLAWQMADADAGVRGVLLEMHECGTQFDSKSFLSIWRFLFMGGIFRVKLHKPHFWILDGLDECINHEEILPLLSKVPTEFPLQFFLTSRPLPELQNDLKSSKFTTMIQEVLPEYTQDDIKRYIAGHTSFSDPQAGDESNLVSTLLTRSNGNFLWVKLVLKELRKLLSVETIRKVLEDVPAGMDHLYRRSLETISEETYVKPLTKAILMWAVCSIRPMTIIELQLALQLQMNDTIHNLENQIPWLCGYLVSVDSHSRVKMVHETARTFVLSSQDTSWLNFDERDAHGTLALICLRCLNNKEMKSPRSRRKETAQANSVVSPFRNYAALSFSEHIARSSNTNSELLNAMYEFCSSQSGNILSWIKYIASCNDLGPIVRTGSVFQSYTNKYPRDTYSETTKLALIDHWGTDLGRIVAKFGRNLIRDPTSIYTIIPPFCPRNSAPFKQFGHSGRGMIVKGIESMKDWDDCLATIVYRERSNRAITLTGANQRFAVGTSSTSVKLYNAKTCQDFGSLPHGEAPKILVFNMSGQTLATAGLKMLNVWDASTKKLRLSFELPSPCISMAFTSDDETLVVACCDNHLYYYDLLEKECESGVEWFMDEDSTPLIATPATAAISVEQKLLAFSYRGSHIGIWNWEEDEFIGLCEKPDARTQRCPFHATSLVFSPALNVSYLAASYEQGEIIVFDPSSGEIKSSYKAKTDDQTLSCSPDGRTLVTGDSSGTIRIFDFQGLDGPAHKLRLLHVIHSEEENIRQLSFCDDKNFVDIRGKKAKVWEPAVLLRQDFPGGETESIQSEPRDAIAEAPEIDPIMSLIVEPSGKFAFCGTESGLITVFNTSSGNRLGELYSHASGDSVVALQFGPQSNLIASAGSSSRVIIKRLSWKGNKVIAIETVFEHHMGEIIEKLLFNQDETKILLASTTKDVIFSVNDNSTNVATWNMRHAGVWCNNPYDPSQIFLVVGNTLRVFAWDGLRELTSGAAIHLEKDVPTHFGINSLFSGWGGSIFATLYSELSHARSNVHLEFWDAASINLQQITGDNASISPYVSLEAISDRIGDLIGTMGMIIGIRSREIFFLDHDGWICSIDAATTEHVDTYNRHFFLPTDWLSTDDTLVFAMTTKNEIILARGEELAIIRKGLNTPHTVNLPPVISRQSPSTLEATETDEG